MMYIVWSIVHLDHDETHTLTWNRVVQRKKRVWSFDIWKVLKMYDSLRGFMYYNLQ